MTQQQHNTPCDELNRVKTQLFGFKVGAGVAAFFIGLFFVYVMSFFSQIDDMKGCLIVIQEQLITLTEKIDQQAKNQEAFAIESRTFRDRLTKLESR